MAARPSARPVEVAGYRVERWLGKGKFSNVYRATRDADGLEVALKVIEMSGQEGAIDAEERRAYIKEVELLRDLTHPNIISFIDTQESPDGERLYIVMELAEIGDLAKLIRKAASRSKPLVEKTIWKLFFQICAGLKHMHEQRIMHRDLKPANVFVGKGGRVKLGDLGLGRKFSSRTFAADSLVGTPYYMAPERVNEVPYDFKSDIWSLGCLLYEMAALQNPFYAEGLQLTELCMRIDRCEYPPLPATYSKPLRQLVASIVVADPDARPDIHEVYEIAKARVQSYIAEPDAAEED
eukprot:c32147_g1_i1.p1 GENE.c32147_g1_i1~~c32147_g1_i1.p1  ORF type:complete len:308 (-),score=60.39 c32147_g1_i1:66-950(-)